MNFMKAFMDESLKKAVNYISSVIKENSNIDMFHLIEEASKKFDLNPLQCEFLINKYLMS